VAWAFMPMHSSKRSFPLPDLSIQQTLQVGTKVNELLAE